MNVTSINSSAEPTIDDLCNWLESKGQRGELKPDQARQRATAIRQLASPLGPDEPKSVGWFVKNLDGLASRFAHLNPGTKSDTAVSYASRARSSCEDFLRWRQDPTGFRFKTTRETTPKEAKQKRVAAEPALDAVPATPAAPSLPTRSFPMTDGADFVFTLPAGGMTVNDVKRLAYHLITLARDFEPGSSSELFSMQRN